MALGGQSDRRDQDPCGWGPNRACRGSKLDNSNLDNTKRNRDSGDGNDDQGNWETDAEAEAGT